MPQPFILINLKTYSEGAGQRSHAIAEAAEIVAHESGAVIGPVGTVAVAYSFGGLAFTLADGSQDFIVGEGFDITVTGGNTVIEGARWLDTLAENAIGRVRLN